MTTTAELMSLFFCGDGFEGCVAHIFKESLAQFWRRVFLKFCAQNLDGFFLSSKPEIKQSITQQQRQLSDLHLQFSSIFNRKTEQDCAFFSTVRNFSAKQF